MILWSIQPKEVLDIIESGKSFRCDGRKSECLRSYKGDKRCPGGWETMFQEPYRWMVQQMKIRGIQKDNRFPVWAWYRYHSADKGRRAPRLRQLFNNCKGKYRLKLSVPDELVLLSDYDMWHEPLNNVFCGSDNYIIKMMSLESNKTWPIRFRWPEEKIRRLKHKSWEKIFDIDPKDERICIQACFPSIESQYLLKADKI